MAVAWVASPVVLFLVIRVPGKFIDAFLIG